MGVVQSSQARQQERGESESVKGARELKNANDDRDFFTSDDEEEVAEKEEVEVAPPKVSPVTTSHVVEGNLRVWDQPMPSGTFLRMPGGARAGGGHVIMPGGQMAGEEVCTYVYMIRSGESSVSTLPELVGGRCSAAVLTPQGQRQARALGLFFLSHGLRFDALLASPLERCKQTALSVSQEINFSQERIEFGEGLVEMSQGLWEGLRKSEVYNGDLGEIMTNLNQDFHAPGGESQRQVEFRMVEFVNNVVLTRSLEISLHKDARVYYAKHDMESSMVQVDVSPLPQKIDALVKGKGRSRTHIIPPPQTPMGISSMMGDVNFDQKLPSMRQRTPSYYVALFSHEMAIKCLLCGLMGFPPQTIDRLCIDHTSVTLLRHSTVFGWKIIHMNDTSHLRSL